MSDLLKKQLRATGRGSALGLTLAEIVSDVGDLGIDPAHVVLSGGEPVVVVVGESAQTTPTSATPKGRQRMKVGLGAIEILLDLDGEESLLAFESFHTADIGSGGRLSPMLLCRGVRDAFNEAVAHVQKNVSLWGFEGLLRQIANDESEGAEA